MSTIAAISTAPGNAGIDLNRCWHISGTKYQTYSGRNYNGIAGFQANEAVALKNFLTSHQSTNGRNILVDLHGWLNETIGDSGLGAYYRNQFGMSNHINSYGTGYLVNWARASLRNCRSTLVEMPATVWSHADVVRQNFASKYINANQNTLYYQKFNVSPDAVYPIYTHQYMTNIRAHSQEAYSIYKSYKNNNLLNNTYEFLIPVYNNMPNDNEVILPDDDNEEEIVTTPDIDVNTGVVASGFKINGDVISNISFNTNIDTINSKLSSINANLKVTSYLDRYGNKASGNVGTGDTLVISNGSTTKSYKVVIYGDNNGDGKTSIVDLLRVQKDILGSSSLSTYDRKASDTNRDGKVDVVDLLRVQKQILGNSTIEQE